MEPVRNPYRTPARVGTNGSTTGDVLAFLDRIIDTESSKRHDLVLGWQLDNAQVAGHHWFKVEKERRGETRRTPRLVAEARQDIPMPVLNVTLKVHDNEVARLSKRNSKITVEPDDASNPAARSAARVATNIIQHHLNDRENGIGWKYLHRDFWDQVVRYGNSPILSWGFFDSLDTVKVPVLSAMKCKGKAPGVEETLAFDEMTGQMMPRTVETPGMDPCGCTLSEKECPADKIEAGGYELDHFDQEPWFDVEAPNPADPMGRGKNKVKYHAKACPMCGGDLEPYTPTFKEASGQDYFGRPLGKDQPLYKAMLAVPSVFSFFPENEGVGIRPHEMRQWAFALPCRLDWVKRYFQKNTQNLQPDNPDDIAEYVPILGEYSAEAKSLRGATGRNVYQNHVVLKVFFSAERTKEFPRGRAIMAASNTILLDGDFYIPGEDGKGEIPRAYVGFARCFPRDGEVWADGYPKTIRSQQNSINMTKSQIIDRREHNVAGILATEGMDLKREWMRMFNGSVFKYKPDPLAPGEKPRVFQTGNPDPSAQQEMNADIQFAQEVVGVLGPDIGELKNPASTPYSTYVHAKQSTDERRQPRLEEALEAITGAIEHQLKLIQRFYREPRQMKVMAADGWELREFKGADIGGQTGVRVEEEPDVVEKSARRDQLVAEMNSGRFLPQTKRAEREVAKILNLPEEVGAESNVQLKSASREFMLWLREGKAPLVDEQLHDASLFHQEIGVLLQEDDAIAKADEVNWREVYDHLYGWDKEFLPKLQEDILAAKGMGWKDGTPILEALQQVAIQQAQVAFQQAQQGHQIALQQYIPQAQMALQQGLPIPPEPPPPQPMPPQPPPYVNPAPLRSKIQHMIVWLWEDMLMQKGVEVTPELKSFMELRGAFEHYRILTTAQLGVNPAEPGAQQMPGVGEQASPEQANQQQQQMMASAGAA